MKSHPNDGLKNWRKTYGSFPFPWQNVWFSNSRHPDSNPQTMRKRSLEINITTYTFVNPRGPTSFQNKVPKSAKKSRTIQAWTSKCPSLRSPMSQDRPRVPQDAKVKPPSMPNNRLRYQEYSEIGPKGDPTSWKMDPGIMRMPTSAKADLCNTSFAKCLVFQF